MALDPINRPLPAEDTIFRDDPKGLSPEVAQAQKRRIEAYEQQRQMEAAQFAEVLAGVSGQAVIMRFLAFCAPYQAINMGEHAQAAVAEGKRRAALWFIEQMQRVDPEMYPRLLMAHAKRVRALNESSEAPA